MRKTAILGVGLVATAVAMAKGILRGRPAQDHDAIDLAAVAANRRIRMRAKPFIGATILVVAGRVELDLRRVVPAPTGVEVSVLMFGGSLLVVVPPEWRVLTSVKTRGALVDSAESESGDDDPALRLEGSAWISRIKVSRRSVLTAVAS